MRLLCAAVAYYAGLGVAIRGVYIHNGDCYRSRDSKWVNIKELMEEGRE